MGEHQRGRDAIDHSVAGILDANAAHRRKVSESGGDPGRPMRPQDAEKLARKVANNIDRKGLR